MTGQLWLVVKADPVRQVHVWPGNDSPVWSGGATPSSSGQAEVRGQGQVRQDCLQIGFLLFHTETRDINKKVRRRSMNPYESEFFRTLSR